MSQLSSRALERLSDLQLPYVLSPASAAEITSVIEVHLGDDPVLDQVVVDAAWLESASDEEFAAVLSSQLKSRRSRVESYLASHAEPAPDWSLASGVSLNSDAFSRL